MDGEGLELRECGVGNGGCDEKGVGNVEERCAGGDGDGGLAVAVGFGGEEEGGGDYGAVQTGPGEEGFVVVRKGVHD